MLAQELNRSWHEFLLQRLALLRSLFVEILGHHHGDQHARPIRNGIAKERPKMRARIGFDVEHNERPHSPRRRQTQRMLPQESLLATLRCHGNTVHRTGCPCALTSPAGWRRYAVTLSSPPHCTFF